VGFFWVQKKVHWSDSDAAGIVWFPNFFGWFEDAEEELYPCILGESRQALIERIGFSMPRVEAHAGYKAPVKPGQMIRIGIRSTVQNPRRLRHDFEIRFEDGTLIADGYVRVACVDSAFKPRDLPAEVLRMVEQLPAAADGQRDPVPWV
jgi:acyl-CoA thioester hydrolase